MNVSILFYCIILNFTSDECINNAEKRANAVSLVHSLPMKNKLIAAFTIRFLQVIYYKGIPNTVSILNMLCQLELHWLEFLLTSLTITTYLSVVRKESDYVVSNLGPFCINYKFSLKNCVHLRYVHTKYIYSFSNSLIVI